MNRVAYNLSLLPESYAAPSKPPPGGRVAARRFGSNPEAVKKVVYVEGNAAVAVVGRFLPGPGERDVLFNSGNGLFCIAWEAVEAVRVEDSAGNALLTGGRW